MRFWVDSWDPGYGTSTEPGLPGARAESDYDIEVPAGRWHPVPAAPVASPPAVHFVDGVRRVDAHLWIDGPVRAIGALAASWAAGVVTCTEGAATVTVVDVRRGLFTPAADATDLSMPLATYRAGTARSDDPADLSFALQNAMAATEVDCALRARTGADDLLVVDGPLLRHRQLARVLGFVKTQATSYLTDELDPVVTRLGPGERTPVFRIGTPWARCSWYLRLPCRPAAPWAGVVRIECPDLAVPDVLALAALSQAVLPRYASVEHKDQRAPQNLTPIGGLEKLLRRRLGDPLLLDRCLRTAAA